MEASEPEVDSSLPQLSNLNSDSIAVEVSIFYNSCSAVVNDFRNVILCIAETVFDCHWFFHHRTQLISEGVSSSLKSLLFVFRLLSQP